MNEWSTYPAGSFPARGRFNASQRRYLGAKTRLLPMLADIVAEHCGDYSSFCDLFGGTGVVACWFNRPGVRVIASDLLWCNVRPMRCFLTTTPYDEAKILTFLDILDNLPANEPNYFSVHFGNTYFTAENATRIGAMRAQIAHWRETSVLTESEEDILLTSLLYATDRVANTCGHYDAYRSRLDTTSRLSLLLPDLPVHSNSGNHVWRRDANALVRELDIDVLYLDPPYNSRQYSDTYHVLENLTTWTRPPVVGRAKKMDRSFIKSAYCGKGAEEAFRDLIAHARCRHLLLSYNNMGTKGDNRSNARLRDDVIRSALQERGEVTEYERPFTAFSAGLSQVDAHTERVFYCRVTTAPEL